MKRYHYQQPDRKVFVIVILIGILIGFSIGYFLFSSEIIPKPIPLTTYVYKTVNMTSSVAEINLAAVDQNGNGVVTPLIVEVRPGDGKVLTDIDKLLFWVDTQQSMQIAKFVAENTTELDVDKYDLIYTIRSNATLVGGPSAGAALTVATIAALENKEVRKDVMITGTINPDGTIGEVGGILEKAKAAKYLGAKVFLVPDGQGTETYLKPEESCTQRGGFLFCTTKYKQITVNIGESAGISVIEVENISDALKYFF